ncbi:hypothetical protein Tco_1433996, partial [Tanacetum coccineum]
SSGPPIKVGDEAVHKELDDRTEKAATNASSLEAEQDSGSDPRCQDTILGDVDAQTRFETTSKQSNDPPLSRGYTLRSGEDNMKLLELMKLCTKLSNMLHKNRKSDLFWSTSKANTVNGERQLQALIDKKKVIITESSIRSDFHLKDAGGTNCLPTATIFEELARMGAKSTAWNEFSNTMASLIICLATNKKFNMSKYIFDAMVKQRKNTAATQEETQQDDSVPTPSNDPPLSGEDSMQLSELMLLCTNLQKQVLDLEKAKDAPAREIADLRKRVQKRVESSKDKESLGNHEDASKQGRRIKDIDKDADVQRKEK